MRSMRRTDAVRWTREGGLLRPLGVVRDRCFLPVVEILDRWAEAGRWWEGEEGETAYFRVRLDDGSVCELQSAPLVGR